MEQWRKLQNDYLLKILGIDQLHEHGIKGEGVKLWAIEKEPGNHAKGVKLVLDEILPFGNVEIKFISQQSVTDIINEAIEKCVHIISTSYRRKYYGVKRGEMEALRHKAESKGIKFFNSIGNTGDDNIGDNAYLTDATFNIGALKPDLSRYGWSSYDSNGTVDFCVPIGFYFDNYGYLQGTSEACPIAAAIYGLLLEVHNFDLTDKKLIHEYTMDIGEDGKDNKTGFGVLSAHSMFYTNNKRAIKMRKPDGNYTHANRHRLNKQLEKGYELW